MKYLIHPDEHLVLSYAIWNEEKKKWDKKPIEPNWTKEKPTTEDALDHYGRSDKNYLGIIPYSLGLVVIDIDKKELEDLIRKKYKSLFKNAVCITNGISTRDGYLSTHIWLATKTPFGNKVLPGGDLRGGKGFIILYKDVYFKNLRTVLKKKGELFSDEIREQNDTLILKLSTLDGKKKKKSRPKFEEGTRNIDLFNELCKVFERGGDRSHLIAVVNRAQKSGLDDPAIQATFRSAKETIKKKQPGTGHIKERLRKIKKVKGKTRDRSERSEKNDHSEVADILEEQYPGLEYVRVGGLDSENKGLEPVIWSCIDEDSQRGVWEKLETNIVAQIIQTFRPECKANFIKEVMFQTAIREERTSGINEWDNLKTLLGLSEGWLWDFDSCSLVPQTKGIRIRLNTPCLPSEIENGKIPVRAFDCTKPLNFWEERLAEWMDNNTTAGKSKRHKMLTKKDINHRVERLQMIMGYSLVPGNPYNYVFFHHGHTGQNGKSMFFSGIYSALGDDLVSALSNTVINKTFRGSHDSALNEVVDSRISVAEEIKKMETLDTNELVRLSGNDRITVRSLYRNMRKTINKSTIHIPTNFHPIKCPRSRDHAAWIRRVIVVPWNFRVPDNDKIHNLQERLDDCREDILRWILEGWIKYKNNNYKLKIDDEMTLKQLQDPTDIGKDEEVDEDEEKTVKELEGLI